MYVYIVHMENNTLISKQYKNKLCFVYSQL